MMAISVHRTGRKSKCVVCGKEISKDEIKIVMDGYRDHGTAHIGCTIKLIIEAWRNDRR